MTALWTVNGVSAIAVVHDLSTRPVRGVLDQGGLRWVARASGLLLPLRSLLSNSRAATRPRYGGTLRVETRQAPETPDPPAFSRTGFTITRWEAGRRAVYEADESAPGGRPFLDRSRSRSAARCAINPSISNSARPTWWNSAPTNCAAQPAGRKVWTSSPVRVLALVFSARFDDARVREALALAVDRSAIHAVLLQRQGEISGALLPQWLSGYAFLFPTAADLPRARSLAAGARPLTLGGETRRCGPSPNASPSTPAMPASTSPSPISPPRPTCASPTARRFAGPAKALAAIAAALGLPEPAPRRFAGGALYNAERALLEGFRVIPLIHLPDVYGAAARAECISGERPGITPSGESALSSRPLASERRQARP